MKCQVAEPGEEDPSTLDYEGSEKVLLQVLPVPRVLVSSQESRSLGQAADLVSVVNSP